MNQEIEHCKLFSLFIKLLQGCCLHRKNYTTLRREPSEDCVSSQVQESCHVHVHCLPIYRGITLYTSIQNYINATCPTYRIYKTTKGHFRLSANKMCHLGLFQLPSSLCGPEMTKSRLVLCPLKQVFARCWRFVPRSDK